MGLIIQGGTVVGEDELHLADVRIEGEHIADVGAHLPTGGAEVISAKGLYVLPGLIDAHTHLGWPGAADDFATGSAAAACGGVTTLVEYAIQYHTQSLSEALCAWHERASMSCVDFSFHLAISDWNDRTKIELSPVMEKGVTSFKLWLTSRHSGGLGVDDGVVYEVMDALSDLGGLLGLHCENDAIIGRLALRAKSKGLNGPTGHAMSRPPVVEAEAIRRAAFLARQTGCSMFVPHLSSALGLEVVREERRLDAGLFAETCPQFLVLTEKVYERPEGFRFVMSPPIKGEVDQAALWEGLRDGSIQTVGSDHCPYGEELKRQHREDFTAIPNGIPGIETMLALLYSEGVQRGQLTLPQVVRLTSTEVARRFGLYPKKGLVSPGSDADIVLFDPDREVTLGPDNLHSRIEYSIYDDFTVRGWPVRTLVRGHTVQTDGHFIGPAGHGRFVPRLPTPRSELV